MKFVHPQLDDTLPMLHNILVVVHVRLPVLFVGVLALIKFDFDTLPIGTTCLIGTGDGFYGHDLPRIAQAHVLRCLTLSASNSSTLS
jgi:hypothetical protein